MNKLFIGFLTAFLAASGIGGYKIMKEKDPIIDVAFDSKTHIVSDVIDGDTIKVENKIKIRLIGIDAPEKKDCFFQESKDYLSNLIEEKEIKLEKDITGKDKYDRLLRYVILENKDPKLDNIFINDTLVRQGYAKYMPSSPDVKYRDLLSSAQEEAIVENRGLWGECDTQIKDPTSLREVDSQPKDSSCKIKGNISEKGYGKNYFLEGCPNYTRVKVDTRKGEQYFCTEKEAQEAGFTRSQSCDNIF